LKLGIVVSPALLFLLSIQHIFPCYSTNTKKERKSENPGEKLSQLGMVSYMFKRHLADWIVFPKITSLEPW
jgi:hypothetical protein